MFEGICPICGRENNIKSRKTCGRKECIKEMHIITNMQKYNKPWHTQVDEVKEKAKATCLKNHNVENIFQDVAYIKKCTKKKLGIDNIFRDTEYIKQCCENKLGVSNPTYLHVGKEVEEILTSKEKFLAFFEKHKNESASSTYIGNLLGVSSKCILDKYREFGLEKYIGTRESGFENIIKDYIESFGLEVIQSSRKIIKPKELDLYIPALKIGIEFNGQIWHCSKYRDASYHLMKSTLCEEKGIKLIHLFGLDWKKKSTFYKNYLKYLILGRPECKFINGKIICEDLELGGYELEGQTLHLDVPCSNLPNLDFNELIISHDLGRFEYKGFSSRISDPIIIGKIKYKESEYYDLYNSGNVIYKKVLF